MVEFFEPEDEYKIDKGRHTNIQTRVVLLTTLVVFGAILIIAVQFNLINIFKEDKIKEVCVYNNTYSRIDDDALKLEKIKRTLSDHLATISDLDGFLGAKIKFDETRKDHKVPVLSFIFEKKSTDKKRIPKTICGFESTVVTNND
jgi:hypothetical protein